MVTFSEVLKKPYASVIFKYSSYICIQVILLRDFEGVSTYRYDSIKSPKCLKCSQLAPAFPSNIYFGEGISKKEHSYWRLPWGKKSVRPGKIVVERQKLSALRNLLRRSRFETSMSSVIHASVSLTTRAALESRHAIVSRVKIFESSTKSFFGGNVHQAKHLVLDGFCRLFRGISYNTCN